MYKLKERPFKREYEEIFLDPPEFLDADEDDDKDKFDVTLPVDSLFSGKEDEIKQEPYSDEEHLNHQSLVV